MSSCKDCKGCNHCRDKRSYPQFRFKVRSKEDIVVALAGNPNVGKSTVFNQLTGLKQHTGNWPGKTVKNARGSYNYKKHKFSLVDLPGTYSLLASSVEEEIARDFICFSQPHVTVVVVDATCLERNLNLVLQVLEITQKVVVCLNLMDEARHKNIKINIEQLEARLGVPVVPTSARSREGLDLLMEKIYRVAMGQEKPTPCKVQYSEEVESVLEQLVPSIEHLLDGRLDARWVALRLIDGDTSILDAIYGYLYKDRPQEVQ